MESGVRMPLRPYLSLFLFIADDGSMELSHLEEMVRSINEAEVAPADRLSDNVFHYDDIVKIS